MGTLKEDIKAQSEWVVEAFKADGYNLDYSIHSTMEVDKNPGGNSSNKSTPFYYSKMLL